MAELYPQLAWREAEPGVWTRGIDDAERLWANVARVEDTGDVRRGEVSVQVSVKVDISHLRSTPNNKEASLLLRTAFRKAWCLFRHHHPSVASHIIYDYDEETFHREYRSIATDADRDDWLNATFIEIEGQSGMTFLNTGPKYTDYPTLYFLTPPASSSYAHNRAGKITYLHRDILFRCAHETADGHGVFLGFSNLLKYASDAFQRGEQFSMPQFGGSEIPNLTPAAPVAAAVPPLPAPELMERYTKMKTAELLALKQNPLPPLLLPTKNSMVAGKSQRTEMILSKETTEKIVAGLKAHNITISGGLNAAIPIAMRDSLERGPEAKRFRSVYSPPIDLRRQIPAPYNGADHPICLYSAMAAPSLIFEIDLPAAVSASDNDSPAAKEEEQKLPTRKEEFLNLAETARTYFALLREDPQIPQLSPIHHATVLPQCPKPQWPRVPISAAYLSATVYFTSLGRLETLLPRTVGPHFEVSKPWGSADRASDGLALSVNTFRDELSLGLTYNDAWFDEAMAVGFLNRFKNVLLEALDIEEPEVVVVAPPQAPEQQPNLAQKTEEEKEEEEVVENKGMKRKASLKDSLVRRFILLTSNLKRGLRMNRVFSTAS